VFLSSNYDLPFVYRFGYPDDTYFDRVLDELKIKGVTEKALSPPPIVILANLEQILTLLSKYHLCKINCRRSCVYKLFDEISMSKSAITLSKLLI
jgi:hypothetical protein